MEILVVEDNKADTKIIEEMLNDTSIDFHMSLVSNGDEALSYLRKEGKYARFPTPRLIILDLNMPRLTGEEFLHKADRLLDGIHIIIFSGSPEMVGKSAGLPHKRMIKPSTNEQYDKSVAELRETLSGL